MDLNHHFPILHPVTIKINGETRHFQIPAGRTLLELIRDDLGLTGTKHGCDDSNCGACTVLLNGQAVKSCCMLALQADGAEVLTIEGLTPKVGLHPLQQSFVDHFAFQCGFCTPGMILTSKAILDENPDASEDDIREGLHGNLCRCTGYKKIVEAVMAVQRGEYSDRSEIERGEDS